MIARSGEAARFDPRRAAGGEIVSGVTATPDQTPAAAAPGGRRRRNLIIAAAAAAVAIIAVVVAVLLNRSGSPTVAGPDLSQCHEEQTDELFVQHLYNCAGSNVYTFANSDARDNWRSVAEGFGAVVLDAGPTWLRVRP